VKNGVLTGIVYPSVPSLESLRNRWAMALATFFACTFGTAAQSITNAVPTRFPPPQLEMRVPFEPTAFPSAGRTHLIYELHLRNFEAGPIALDRVEVLDADINSAPSVKTFVGEQLDAILQPVGARPSGGVGRSVAGGGSAVVFIAVALDAGARVPNRLRHRIVTTESAVEGAEIGTHHTELRILAPPLRGPDWLARSGPSNDSYHRRGTLVLNGNATIDRRYAIDWVRRHNDATFSGDALKNDSYYAYGQDVLAVADGTVIAARDGIPENVPRHDGFRPAVPLSMDTLAGNSITLAIADGQFAHYMHLQPGSLQVKAGDRVRRGQVLARIGNSGDSREPHLHFEVTTSSTLLAGEGVPYLIDHFQLKTAGDSWQARTRELPLADMAIDFGQRQD
jgi:Peptidase family M23